MLYEHIFFPSKTVSESVLKIDLKFNGFESYDNINL